MSFKKDWDTPPKNNYLEQVVSMKRKTWLLTNGIYAFVGFAAFYIFLS